MIGMRLRESMDIMLFITLTTLPFVSTVESPICYWIVSVLAMKQRSRTTGKRRWTSTLMALPIMEGARSGPKVVVVMALKGSMDPGLN